MVHVGVSITVVPVTSTLNRVMIVELGFTALAVGALISLAYLLSPFQVLVGEWSDTHTLWGRHRAPWIVIGGLLASFGSYLTAHAAYAVADNLVLGILACIVTFGMWGIGINMASVSYLSLATDLSEGHQGWRSRTVSVMWTAMIIATILASLTLSFSLRDFSEQALYTAFGAVWLVATALVLFGAARLEPPPADGRALKHDAHDMVTSLRALAANPSAQRFFIYLFLILISIHAQDVLLEPYGGQVLGMNVAQTSRLTSIWGVGVLVTLLAGLPLIRRYGKKVVANSGAWVAAAGFALIILSGWWLHPKMLMTAVMVLGIGGGLMTVSNLSFMLDMTVPEAAGLFMGAWGVANFGAQGLGNIVSGLLRDLLYNATGSDFLGYALVFGLEIVGLLVAVWLFRDISVTRFRRDAEARLAEILEYTTQ